MAGTPTPGPRTSGSGWHRIAPAVLVLALLTAGCTQTTIPGLGVHTAPTLGSPVIDDIPKSGTPVRVECWTRGDVVQNDDVWYRIGSPKAGYVTNYYIRSTGDFANAPPC